MTLAEPPSTLIATCLTGAIGWIRFQGTANVAIVGGHSCALGSLGAAASKDTIEEPSSAPAAQVYVRGNCFPIENRLHWRFQFRRRTSVALTALCSSLPLIGTADGQILQIQHTDHDISDAETSLRSPGNGLVAVMKPGCTPVVGLSAHAMVTDGGQLFSIDLKSGQWSIYATHGTGFTAFACSEGASGIVTATRSGHVQYWDLRTPIHVRQNNLIANHVAAGSDEMFPLPPASIPLCLDMDERRVVAGTDAGDILEWDRRQTTKHLRADHLHEDAVCDVRCLRSTDGYQQIASCGMDGRVYFGSTANDLGPVARGGPGADFAMSMDVNQTERLVAFGGDAGLLYVHKL